MGILNSAFLNNKIQTVRTMILMARILYKTAQVYQENSKAIEKSVTRQMKNNPIPALSASFIIGFLISRRLRK